ncbi:MAG: hypothetical protein ACKOBM_07560 [Gammaproteobacteria bacterium]
MTASIQGSALKVFAATTATKPPYIKLVATGRVSSVTRSRRKLRATSGVSVRGLAFGLA